MVNIFILLLNLGSLNTLQVMFKLQKMETQLLE